MQPHPRILGIIPARKGSKGIPGKNTKLLAGKPLICYSIEAALKSCFLSTIMVSSDCENVLAITKTYPNVEVPFVRPAELATDQSPSVSLIQHALEFYKSRGVTFDYTCLLQPTTPFRSCEIIDQAITEIRLSGADSLFTGRKIPTHFHPFRAYTAGMNGAEPVVSNPNYQRRQDLPETFYPDGQIYLTGANLIENGQILGGKISLLRTESSFYVNLDSPGDWIIAENLINDASYG